MKRVMFTIRSIGRVVVASVVVELAPDFGAVARREWRRHRFTPVE